MQSNFRIPKGCRCILHVKTMCMSLWVFGTHFPKTTLKMLSLVKCYFLQIEHSVGRFLVPFIWEKEKCVSDLRYAV